MNIKFVLKRLGGNMFTAKRPLWKSVACIRKMKQLENRLSAVEQNINIKHRGISGALFHFYQKITVPIKIPGDYSP